MPFKSATVHPIASLCFFNIANKLSSWSFCRSEAMMTRKVSLEPRKAYLSLFGSGFNSSFGGDSREGTRGVLKLEVGAPWVVCMDENMHWQLSLARHLPHQCIDWC
jgi:hypothetical protein